MSIASHPSRATIQDYCTYDLDSFRLFLTASFPQPLLSYFFVVYLFLDFGLVQTIDNHIVTRWDMYPLDLSASR